MKLGTVRRNQGLCVDCGGEAMEDLRHLLGVAQRLAREKGFPVPRFLRQARCGPCYKKHSDAIKKAYKRKVRRRREIRLAQRKRAKRLLADGLCRECGKHPKTDTSLTCERCGEKAREMVRKKYERRKNAWMCVRCGRPLELLKYVNCQKCRDSDTEKRRASYVPKKKESTA